MCGVKHTVSLFFKDVTKIPVLNKMITSHKAIYNLFGSGIYSNQNHMSFTIGTLLYLVEMIPQWLVISL